MRDVTSLKEMERQTQDALEAVHGTLGHVVDRLAMIETDMRDTVAPAGDIAPVPPASAATPAQSVVDYCAQASHAGPAGAIRADPPRRRKCPS